MNFREFIRAYDRVETRPEYWIKYGGTNRVGEVKREHGHSDRRIPAVVLDAEVIEHCSEVNFCGNKVVTVKLDVELPTTVEYTIHGNRKFSFPAIVGGDDDEVEIKKQFSSLDEATLWVLCNIPNYWFGCNISNAYGDFSCIAVRDAYDADDANEYIIDREITRLMNKLTYDAGSVDLTEEE